MEISIWTAAGAVVLLIVWLIRRAIRSHDTVESQNAARLHKIDSAIAAGNADAVNDLLDGHLRGSSLDDRLRADPGGGHTQRSSGDPHAGQ